MKKDPERFAQLWEASRVRREVIGQLNLGSRGRRCFTTYFQSSVGRKPTYKEYRDAYHYGAHCLVDHLIDEGMVANLFDASHADSILQETRGASEGEGEGEEFLMIATLRSREFLVGNRQSRTMLK